MWVPVAVLGFQTYFCPLSGSRNGCPGRPGELVLVFGPYFLVHKVLDEASSFSLGPVTVWTLEAISDFSKSYQQHLVPWHWDDALFVVHLLAVPSLGSSIWQIHQFARAAVRYPKWAVEAMECLSLSSRGWNSDHGVGQGCFLLRESLVQASLLASGGLCAKLSQSCPTLCDPMDCSLLGWFVHEILQARILEWVVMPSSKGSPWPRVWTHVSYGFCIGRQVL